MKKAVMFATFTVSVVILLGLVSAANNNFANPSAAVAAAYQCLSDKTVNETGISLQEAVFSTYALGYQNSTDATISKQGNGNCWPSSSCTVKETAQVALAYDLIWKNTTGIQSWLLNRNITVTELQWLLEIDSINHGATSCTITDGSSTSNVAIGTDMKISGNTGACLAVDSTGYLLQVNPSCLSHKFSVSCDQDFISTMLYKKASGSTYYVSSDTQGAPALGTTDESISAKCFQSATGSGCDYEGSLWAAIALQHIGYDVTPFVPYLLALADDNTKLFPSAFIYLLTGANDQYSSISNQITGSNQNQYWQIGNNSRYYDTSLALLALNGISPADNAKNYLLGIQPSAGCWNNNNIRDTGFVLFSGWPQAFGTSQRYPNSTGPTGPLVGGAGSNPTITNGTLRLNVISPVQGATYSSSVRVNISSGNASLIYYSFGGANRTYCSSYYDCSNGDNSVSIPLANGSQSLVAYAMNDTNLITQSVTFSIVNSSSQNIIPCTLTSQCATGYTCQLGLCQSQSSFPIYLGNGTSNNACTNAGYSCSSSFSCLDAGGTVLSSYPCSGLQACCSVQVQTQACSTLGGILCSSNQQCSGNVVPASDGSCCMTSCTNVQEQNICESSLAGTCRSACLTSNGETEVSASCSAGQVCCASGISTSSGSSSGGSSWWIWLLLGILVILAILGVVYKDKVRLWIYKMQGKVKTSPVNRPGAPVGGIMPVQRRPIQFGGQRPAPAGTRPVFRQPIRPQPRPMPAKKPEQGKERSQKDKDFEETLRKLREMSK